jgi:hypothetical protein
MKTIKILLLAIPVILLTGCIERIPDELIEEQNKLDQVKYIYIDLEGNEGYSRHCYINGNMFKADQMECEINGTFTNIIVKNYRLNPEWKDLY